MDGQKEYFQSQRVKGESWKGTAKDIKKKPRSFKIGIFSIFLVIGFLAAIQSAFQLSPVIFLSIAEDQVGDSDMLLTPLPFSNRTSTNTPTQSTSTSSPSSSTSSSASRNSLSNTFSEMSLLNQTQIDQACSRTEGIEGCSPRWILLASLYNPLQSFPINFRSYLITVDSTNGKIYIFSQRMQVFEANNDIQKERSIGMGRRFQEDLLLEDEAYLTATTVRGLELEEGDDITMNLDVIDAILKNGNLLNLQDNSKDGVKALFVTAIRSALIAQFPQLIDSNGKEVTLNKTQIIQITTRISQFATLTDSPLTRTLLYAGMQNYFDSQGIKINARDTLSPIVESGNLVKLSQNLSNQAQLLPADYKLNTTQVAIDVAPVLMRALNVTTQFTIKSSVDNPKGKWSAALGNTIMVDSRYILSKLWRVVSKNIDTNIRDPALVTSGSSLGLISQMYQLGNASGIIGNMVQGVDINQYAITSNAVFAKRIEIYPSSQSIQKNIVTISNKFARSMGAMETNYEGSVPLALSVNGFLVLKMFLDNMIATSIFLLVMLAVLLIYSLMISDVEEKTYEFGMLRALGFQKSSLVYLLIVEGLFFAVPGLVLGLVMAYVLNSLIAYIIFNQSLLVTSYNLHWSAIVLAAVLGIFIPLISVYLPIQRALSKTLRDSLDLYRRAVNDIFVTVQRLEKLGVSFAQSVNSVVLILMGVICYYFAPAAFVKQDIALFLAIINAVLILMILGFTLLLNLTQPLIERVFVSFFLCFFPKQRHLRPLILKNMDGHRRRNGKTAIMYTVALSFLIFAGTGFNLQSKSIQDNLKSSLGSDIKVLLLNDLTGLDEYGMRQFLSSYMKKNPSHIKGFSFATLPINKFPKMTKPNFSSLSQFPLNSNMQLRGIESNYLSSVYLDFYFPVEFNPNVSFPKLDAPGSPLDAVYGLYSDEDLLVLANSLDYHRIISNSDIRDQSLINSPNITSGSGLSQSITYSSLFPKTRFDDQEIKLIIPSGLHFISSVDVTTPCLLSFNSFEFRATIRATAKKFPGFKFSSYRQISFYGEILTGMDQFKYLLDSLYYYQNDDKNQEVLDFFKNVQPQSSFGLPKTALTVQFKEELSRFDREAIGNGLRNYFKSDFTQLFDVPAIVQSIDDTLFFINLFSLIVATISIILSFFLILVSFVANIKENSWEFGVLRAIGLSKVDITRVYMVESCSLVLASGTIGTIIGITVAVTLTLQLLMFTELPFQFVFPYSMFFTTFFFGLFIAAGASYTALLDFKDKPISAIVKGLL